MALTERKAAATKFAGNKFLRKKDKNELAPQTMRGLIFVIDKILTKYNI